MHHLWTLITGGAMTIESQRERILLAVVTGVVAGGIWGAGSATFMGATVLGGSVYGLAIGLIWGVIWYIMLRWMWTRRNQRRTGL